MTSLFGDGHCFIHWVLQILHACDKPKQTMSTKCIRTHKTLKLLQTLDIMPSFMLIPRKTKLSNKWNCISLTKFITGVMVISSPCYICNEQPLVANSISCPHIAGVEWPPVCALSNASIRLFCNQNNRSLIQSRFGMMLYRRFCV